MGSICLSLFILAKDKGYELICYTTMNCFFIKKDLFSLFNVLNNYPLKLQAMYMKCFIGINYAEEIVFSNKGFFITKLELLFMMGLKK